MPVTRHSIFVYRSILPTLFDVARGDTVGERISRHGAGVAHTGHQTNVEALNDFHLYGQGEAHARSIPDQSHGRRACPVHRQPRRRRAARVLALLGVLSLAPGRSAVAQEPEGAIHPPVPLPLAWCLERAEANNATLAMDEALAEAAQHRIRPAGSLEDPRLRTDLVNLPLGDGDLHSSPMSGLQFGLAQKLPFPGLLAAREGAAREAAKAAASGVADRRLRVRAAVEAAWVDLGFAQRALAITDRNLALLRQLAEVAAARYRVGRGRQQDVLRAQVELTRLLDERLRRKQAIATREALLAQLLDLPPDVALGRTAAISERAPLPDREAVLQQIEAHSPRLRELAARVREARHARRATELAGYPDVDLGIGYRVRQNVRTDPVRGQDFLSAGLTIRLPVNRAKWREQVAERGAQLRHAKAAWRDERASLRDAGRSAYAVLERADGQVTLLETGLLPQARQSLASSRSGYEVDKVDFLSLIDSQVSLLDAELALVRAKADRRVAFASLEAVAGEELR